MALSDVNAIIKHYENDEPGFFVIHNCSRSKAYSIKRDVDKQLNPHDRFCEVKYDADTKTARFEIVS